MNSLQQLHAAGQSIWLDFLRRGLITGGALERWIREDAVSGVTSNPSIFEKAIGDSTDYDDTIRAIAEKGQDNPIGVFYDLALSDVLMAADAFRPVYDSTEAETASSPSNWSQSSPTTPPAASPRRGSCSRSWRSQI
jgi:transaldolase